MLNRVKFAVKNWNFSRYGQLSSEDSTHHHLFEDRYKLFVYKFNTLLYNLHVVHIHTILVIR